MKFGTDGVRGVANIDLTASFALDLGRAAARVLGGSEAVVGGDTRLSTAMLEAAFVAGLASEGVVVHRLGVVATPVVAFEAARRNCLGAVISASHNPYRDNGIKLFARGGSKLTDEVEQRIEEVVVDLPRADGRPGPARRRRGQPGLRRARPAARSAAAASTGCGSSSTPPTAPPARWPGRCWRSPAPTSSPSTTPPTGATSTPAAGRPTRRRWPPPSSPTVPTSGSPSTATPTGCWPSTTPAALVDGDHIIGIRAIDRHAAGRAARRHGRRDRDDEPRLPPRHGGGRHQGRRDRRRRPLRARGPRRRRLLARRRAERPRHLPRPGHDRRRAAHRRSSCATPSTAPVARSPSWPPRR